ncbi:MAG: hypothetical protein AB7D06_01625 [Pedobacter sp.]
MQINTPWVFWPVKRLCYLVLGAVLFTGCAPSHVLHHDDDVSRDYTYITFLRNRSPYRLESQVGGEHISSVTVLGFEGDIYQVELDSRVGDVDCYICGEGIHVERDPATINKQTVTVLERDCLFSVELSAYPYGEYMLRISKQ